MRSGDRPTSQVVVESTKRGNRRAWCRGVRENLHVNMLSTSAGMAASISAKHVTLWRLQSRPEVPQKLLSFGSESS